MRPVDIPAANGNWISGTSDEVFKVAVRMERSTIKSWYVWFAEEDRVMIGPDLGTTEVVRMLLVQSTVDVRYQSMATRCLEQH